MTGSAALQAGGVSKHFGAVQVLFGVDFDLVPGEVHALIGENGAGKSTLMRILSGYHQPSAGQLTVDGKETVLESSAAAERLGIVMIHQELALAEHLSVEANIFLGRERNRGWLLDTKSMRAQAAGLLADLDCRADPRARVSDLAVSDKQLVESAIALSAETRFAKDDLRTRVSASRQVLGAGHRKHDLRGGRRLHLEAGQELVEFGGPPPTGHHDGDLKSCGARTATLLRCALGRRGGP